MSELILDALRKEVMDTIYGQRDWLDAMTVAKPAAEAPTEWVRKVERMLSELHLDGVDVTIAEGETGPPWLRSTKLTPGWS